MDAARTESAVAPAGRHSAGATDLQPSTAGTDPVTQPGEKAHLAPADQRRPLRSVVIYNPVRVDDLAGRQEAVAAALTDAGWPPAEWIETTAEDPGAGQARQAIADGAELVFVCGGDGTVRSTIEGVAGTDIPLAVLPAGTGNLLATNLGVPDDPRAGVHLATQWGRRRLDIGDVDGQAFAVMAGMGFDAALLDDASTELKAKIGPLAYVLSAVQHLRDRRANVRVTLDGRPPVRRRARSVVIGNVGRLQGGVRLLADAEPDDGQMDVAIIAPRTLGHWVTLAWGIVRRSHDVAHMQVLRGSRITVAWDQEQPRELDGDVIEPGRSMTVEVRPEALLLCVPQPESSPDLAEGSEHLSED